MKKYVITFLLCSSLLTPAASASSNPLCDPLSRRDRDALLEGMIKDRRENSKAADERLIHAMKARSGRAFAASATYYITQLTTARLGNYPLIELREIIVAAETADRQDILEAIFSTQSAITRKINGATPAEILAVFDELKETLGASSIAAAEEGAGATFSK